MGRQRSSANKAAGSRSANKGPRMCVGVLFTCIGRRVSLLSSFRQAAHELGLKARFYGTETSRLSAALQLCDEGFLVKPTSHRSYIRQLLSIVREKNVTLLVPTVDLDLRSMAEDKHRFAELGCKVLVSDPHVVQICQDKRKTYRFLFKHGFDTPLTASPRSILSGSRSTLGWPCFVKPWDGYASRGNAVVRDRSELRFFVKRIPNAICQEYVEGTEYTCDAYVDFRMHCRCVVPRRRIEVRSGEVSKGQVVKDARIMSQVAAVVETLGAGPGVVTLQLFLTPTGQIRIIEINPRFGGGAPLSIRAGARFPRWVLQELTGARPRIRFDGFEDGLIMLRYDGEVWFQNHTAKGTRV